MSFTLLRSSCNYHSRGLRPDSRLVAVVRTGTRGRGVSGEVCFFSATEAARTLDVVEVGVEVGSGSDVLFAGLGSGERRLGIFRTRRTSGGSAPRSLLHLLPRSRTGRTEVSLRLHLSAHLAMVWSGSELSHPLHIPNFVNCLGPTVLLHPSLQSLSFRCICCAVLHFHLINSHQSRFHAASLRIYVNFQSRFHFY